MVHYNCYEEVLENIFKISNIDLNQEKLLQAVIQHINKRLIVIYCLSGKIACYALKATTKRQEILS